MVVTTVFFWGGNAQNRGLTFHSFILAGEASFVLSVCLFFHFGGRWGWVGIKCFTHGKWDVTSEGGNAV